MRKRLLLISILFELILIGCGSNDIKNTTTSDIKTNTSQKLTDEEWKYVGNLMGYDLGFETFQLISNSKEQLHMDFSSCWLGSDDGEFKKEKCDYEVAISSKTDNKKKHYNFGIKDKSIYIYYPDGVKKYDIKDGDAEYRYIFVNELENCASTIDGDKDLLNKDTDENPCTFLE